MSGASTRRLVDMARLAVLARHRRDAAWVAYARAQAAAEAARAAVTDAVVAADRVTTAARVQARAARTAFVGSPQTGAAVAQMLAGGVALADRRRVAEAAIDAAREVMSDRRTAAAAALAALHDAAAALERRDRMAQIERAATLRLRAVRDEDRLADEHAARIAPAAAGR